MKKEEQTEPIDLKKLKGEHKKKLEEHNKMHGELCKMNEVIMEEERKIMLPALKEKYEGRYWKEIGPSGVVAYIYCRKAYDSRGGYFDIFRKDLYCLFVNEWRSYEDVCCGDTEITKEEYMVELTKLLNKVNELFKVQGVFDANKEDKEQEIAILKVKEKEVGTIRNVNIKEED